MRHVLPGGHRVLGEGMLVDLREAVRVHVVLEVVRAPLEDRSHVVSPPLPPEICHDADVLEEGGHTRL
eukprot:13645728-Alexandrium_andersonii.AAC.1